MIRAATLIEKVARYLTDFDSTDSAYQHVEWSKRDLLDYFQTAAMMVAAASKTASTCRKELVIGDDPFLELPEGCDDLLRVLGYIDPQGRLQAPVKLQKTEDDVFVSTRPVCVATSAGGTKSVTVRVDEGAGDVITVEPFEPGGKLILSCSCIPDVMGEDSEVNISGKYEPVVFWWMVSMAFGTDIEGVPMRDRSDNYWKRGMDLMLLLDPKATNMRRGA